MIPNIYGEMCWFFWDKDVLRRELWGFASSVTGDLGYEPRLLTKRVTNVKAATGKKKKKYSDEILFYCW